MSTDTPDAAHDDSSGKGPIEQLADVGTDARTDEPGQTGPESDEAGSEASTF